MYVHYTRLCFSRFKNTGSDMQLYWLAYTSIINQWVLAARARPCAARTRLFGLIATPNGALRTPHLRPSQLRCFSFDPKKFIKSVELGPPTSRAFFFPQDHRGYEISALFVILFFLISSYSSLLILLFLPLLILLVGAMLRLLFISSYILNCSLYYDMSAILRGFSRGSSLI